MPTEPQNNPLETLEGIQTLVRELDQALGDEDDYFKSAVLLLAALSVGQDVERLADFTGFPLEFIEPRAWRLKKNGIWKDGQTRANWFDEDGGGVAFWMDVALAEGLLESRSQYG